LLVIRRFDYEEAGEMTFAPNEPRSLREEPATKQVADAGLLSPKASAAVGSAFNTLTETVTRAVTRGCGSRSASPHAEVVAG
jgi:hypothetical protein